MAIITGLIFLTIAGPFAIERWWEHEQRRRRYRDYMRHAGHREHHQQDPDEEIHLLFL
jgi:hypothetical protein